MYECSLFTHKPYSGYRWEGEVGDKKKEVRLHMGHAKIEKKNPIEKNPKIVRTLIDIYNKVKIMMMMMMMEEECDGGDL